MYAEDMTYITRMDDTVFLGTTAIDIRTFCDLFGMTIDNGMERRIQMLKNHMVMNKRASLSPVNLDGVVKEYFKPIHSEGYVGLDTRVTFIDETVLSSETFKIDYLGDLIEPTPDWPKQKPWGYLHEDGTKQYI